MTDAAGVVTPPSQQQLMEQHVSEQFDSVPETGEDVTTTEELCWGDAGLFLSIPNSGLGGAAVMAIALVAMVALLRRHHVARIEAEAGDLVDAHRAYEVLAHARRAAG